MVSEIFCNSLKVSLKRLKKGPNSVREGAKAANLGRRAILRGGLVEVNLLASLITGALVMLRRLSERARTRRRREDIDRSFHMGVERCYSTYTL